MPGPATNVSRRAAATANRLRLIQIDFADESPDTRREYLSQEIKRALEGILPEERKAFLEELMERFPSWDSGVEVTAPAEETVAQSPMDIAELQDPSFLLQRLIEVSKSLSEEERAALVKGLREAGLAAVEKSGWPSESEEVLRKRLSLGSRQEIDPRRLIQLAAAFAGFVLSLDKIAWKAWHTLAPKARIQHGDMRDTICKYLAASEDVSHTDMREGIERVRQISAAIIAGFGNAGRLFGARHGNTFAPSVIQHHVSTEGGGFLTSQKVRCWDKYCELFTAYSVEKELNEAISSFAISLMKGVGR